MHTTFKVNYLMVVFTVTLITLAFNPTSLIVLGLLAMAWIYLFVVRQAPIVIGGRDIQGAFLTPWSVDPLAAHMMLCWDLNVFWARHTACVGKWPERVRLVVHLQ